MKWINPNRDFHTPKGFPTRHIGSIDLLPIMRVFFEVHHGASTQKEQPRVSVVVSSNLKELLWKFH